MASESVATTTAAPIPGSNHDLWVAGSSAAIDGVADILGSMIGEVVDMDGRLFACVELLRRISTEMDAHV